jgi:septal ring factor EnvC (AmiA/AmiB activator)
MISAPEGREVRAVHHGRVAFADWLRGFGLLMIVDHGDGYMTLYGHNQSLFKEVGDWVGADEAIALVGNSGGRERSGVYFGIRFKGRPVNPTKWCRRLASGKVG